MTPKNPNLSPAKPIRKGKGGLPRILSLAAERAKTWYFHPKKCKALQSHPHRKTRSERREACQIVIETILSHLDLASLCLGTTLANKRSRAQGPEYIKDGEKILYPQKAVRDYHGSIHDRR